MTDPKLPRELHRAFARRKSRERGFNLRVLADEAGVPHGWVRSVFAGQIARPPADKLRKLAEPLGIPADTLLALTDQLGASAEPAAQPAPDQAAVFAFMERQTIAMEQMARSNQQIADLLAQLAGVQEILEFVRRPEVQQALSPSASAEQRGEGSQSEGEPEGDPLPAGRRKA